MRYFLYFILLIWSFISCSKEYTPPPQEMKEIPVVLGEISPNKDISIVLSQAKNITLPNNENKGIFKNVILLDSIGNELGRFSQQDEKHWNCDYKTQANSVYTLQFEYNNKEIKVETKTPAPFSTKIIKQTPFNDTLSLNVLVMPISQDLAYYVVECWQYFNGEYANLSMINTDNFTDNFNYKELTSPFGRLFFKTSTAKQLKLKIIPEFSLTPNTRDFIEIRVKSVQKKYYEYLYNYELQKQGETIYLPNNSDYLGVFAGAYNVVLRP